MSAVVKETQIASYFIQQGWRTKPLHELILTSRAYRRVSRWPESEPTATQLRTDATRLLLWRANRRRLDLETVAMPDRRITGELDDTMFGRPVTLTDDTNRRRTIYAFVERQNIPALVQTFDFANADTSTPRRNQTTVPQQGRLFALNSPFILARAAGSGERGLPGSNPGNGCPGCTPASMAADPTPTEREECDRFLTAGSVEQLAQVLLMSNELMFVD